MDTMSHQVGDAALQTGKMRVDQRGVWENSTKRRLKLTALLESLFHIAGGCCHDSSFVSLDFCGTCYQVYTLARQEKHHATPSLLLSSQILSSHRN